LGQSRIGARREVAAGGFNGVTNPAFVQTVVDGGPNAASFDDIKVMPDSLGYVLSQGSAFLLDGDNPDGVEYTPVRFGANGPPVVRVRAERVKALTKAVANITPDALKDRTKAIGDERTGARRPPRHGRSSPLSSTPHQAGEPRLTTRSGPSSAGERFAPPIRGGPDRDPGGGSRAPAC
jgi:hypothetical protein